MSTPPAGTPAGPVPWAPGPGWGFTSPGTTPWLTFGDRADADTAAVQDSDPHSAPSVYRRLVAARRSVTGAGLLAGPVRWLPPPADGVLAYERGHVLVGANPSDQPATLALPEQAARTTSWSRLYSTRESEPRSGAPAAASGSVLPLAPREAVMLVSRP